MIEDATLLDWVLRGACGLLGLLYWHANERIRRLEQNTQNHERLLRLEAAVPSEFERAELARQRLATADNIKGIFNVLEEIKERSTKRHLEILDKIDTKQDKAR